MELEDRRHREVRVGAILELVVEAREQAAVTLEVSRAGLRRSDRFVISVPCVWSGAARGVGSASMRATAAYSGAIRTDARRRAEAGDDRRGAEQVRHRRALGHAERLAHAQATADADDDHALAVASLPRPS